MEKLMEQTITHNQPKTTAADNPKSLKQRLQAETAFLRQIMSLNLSSAMEYRASFISQILGMMVNNGIMLIFWLIFFDQFGNLGGYGFQEVLLIYGIVAFSYGISHMLAGNVGYHLAYLIAQGRLDYYLVFPRNLLIHIIFSRMQISAIGDLVFGLCAAVFIIGLNPLGLAQMLTLSLLAAAVITAYGVFAGSMAFFMGNAQNASQQMMGGLLTFSLYPSSIFSGGGKLLMYTLIPAAFVGGIPVEILRGGDGRLWLWMITAVIIIWLIATTVFYLGVRRYESGSAINVNV